MESQRKPDSTARQVAVALLAMLAISSAAAQFAAAECETAGLICGCAL